MIDKNKKGTWSRAAAEAMAWSVTHNHHVLDLRQTALTEVPSIIGGMKHLKFLLLDDNRLTQLPDWLAEDLPELMSISVTGNPIERVPDKLKAKIFELDERETELKEIPIPRGLRKLARTRVDVGSIDFFNTLADGRNKLINAIESNDPTELKSIVIYSTLEGSLDIIKPILIDNFKEKGWQLDIGVVESENLNNKNFDREFAICQISETDTRSLLSKIFHVNLTDFMPSNGSLSGISVLVSILSAIIGFNSVSILTERQNLLQERRYFFEVRDQLKKDEAERATTEQMLKK
jgi:Leucine-rich repeat (LRR) protein